ncbi:MULTISPECIES: ABC transporter ATP-binding protein [Nesterenkonia]|uniref:Iron complex transport system ATP-binding protein n=1 Tax=Nesterenkonia xinjiangensis TaxID=225327 RepID=A0A7Z0GNW6_9MICC|nr:MULTISPECIES: ABC transporter ATP-binding protein [Nesterenkonia]MDZ5078002.1 ABC transporter ATP-binding protein [Nesterenkonia sp. HG001]NYJ79392.1 iron complex transport system ATP-binding protein [Nesterenkonia xinjiangensis]
MSPVLDIQGVSVRRGRKNLLDDVTWSVAEDERWVVLGPNGAGKTTLLQIAAARLHPTVGSVQILDETLGAVDVFELRPRIGLCSNALASSMPVGERALDMVVTAAYGVTGRWREEYERLDERRAFELLNSWGVGTLFDRTFSTLSEGERKRVQIARALMTDPELLLLDEPGAGLDLAGRESLVHRTAELVAAEEAPTTVLVTHHLEEIPPGFTHVLLLREGRTVAQGPIREVLTSENLSTTFDIPLQLHEREGRFSAFATTG